MKIVKRAAQTARQDWQDSKGGRLMAYYFVIGAVFLGGWSLWHEHSAFAAAVWTVWFLICAVVMIRYEADKVRDRREDHERELRLIEQESRVRGLIIRAEHLMLGERR